MSKYNSFYCPFCCRNIEPECDDDGDEIEMPEGGRVYVYVHDDVPHDPDYRFEELQ